MEEKTSLNLEINPTNKQRVCWNKLLDNCTEFIMFGGGAGGRQRTAIE